MGAAASSNTNTKSGPEPPESPTAQVEALSRALGGVVIVQKGGHDHISGGDAGRPTTLTVDLPGGLKRSGGQGDTLTGCIATLLAWRAAYAGRLWDHDGALRDDETLGLAAFGGAAVTRVSPLFFFPLSSLCPLFFPFLFLSLLFCKSFVRRIVRVSSQTSSRPQLKTCAYMQECSRLAFEKHGRALQASDLTEQVHVAFLNILGEPKDDGK